MKEKLLTSLIKDTSLFQNFRFDQKADLFHAINIFLILETKGSFKINLTKKLTCFTKYNVFSLEQQKVLALVIIKINLTRSI
jgi:hypothetical protein